MYEILKTLQKTNKIMIIEPNGSEFKTYPIKDLYVEWGTETINLPIEEYNEDWDNYYQNVVIKELPSDLIIYQDYGDEGCTVPDGYKYLPKDLLFSNNSPSLGWYDGYVCYVDLVVNSIQVTKLFPMSEDDFWKGYELSTKRPYDFSICVPETQKLDDPIYYYIWLGEYILYKTNYTLKDLVDADNLNYMISPYKDETEYYQKNWITRDWLVINGFSFDRDNKCWTKGNFKLYDDCTSNSYFSLDKEEENDVFTVDEISKYL